MDACGDSPAYEGSGVDVAHICAPAGRQIEREVEVAVVESSIPADVDLMTTHQGLDGRGVVRVSEFVEIRVEFSFAFQVAAEASDGDVGDGVEAGEDDSEARLKFAAVVRFESGLRRRE